MTTNRAQRRALKHKAETAAARLASQCYDFEGGGLARVTDPAAIAALARAFAHLLRNGGRPLAVPISEAEAAGFPRWTAERVPGGVTWLAVGLDTELRASYALQSALGGNRALSHEAARAIALSRLAGLCATAGFPMGMTQGRA